MAALLPYSALENFHWSDTPMWVFDMLHQRMLWANPAGVAFWKADSLEEFLARDFADLSEATVTRNQVVMAEHAAGRTARAQWTVYPKGHPVTINAHSIGVELADGRVAILYEAHSPSLSLDPAVLRGVEAMQHTSVLIALFSRSGSAVMRNPAAVRAFGAVDSSAKQDDFQAMFAEPETAQAIHRQLNQGKNYSSEIQLATLNGIRWYGMDAHLVPDPVTGAPLVLINARDINELKTMQVELQSATQAAMAANVAKSQFLANMSHEIRTPMNGVMGMTRLLMETPLSAEQQDYARDIAQSGESLLAIINDILDLSKIEAGHMTFEQQPFKVTEMVDAVLSVLKERAREKGIGLAVGITPAARITFVGDSLRIHQVLLNLAGNAVKFTEQGEVRLSVSRLDHGLRFEISDTGIGIAPSERGRLFSNFSQIDASTSRKYGGTGLGLVICKRLVEGMQGRIGLAEDRPVGSLFWFELPVLPLSTAPTEVSMTPEKTVSVESATTPARAPLGASNPAPKPTCSGRILLVEDNKINQKLVLTLLQRMGYTVDLAENGLQGVAAAGKQPYALILMDMQMPEMDGLEATRHIRRGNGINSHSPIVALTANAMLADQNACREAGMNDFLSKPFNRATLVACLERWII